MHTPGPWKFSFESVDPEWAVVTNASGLVIANVNADSRQQANARLVAAAPDLLAVLTKLMEAKDATAAYYSSIPDGCAADPEYGGRLVRRELNAEDAARALLVHFTELAQATA